MAISIQEIGVESLPLYAQIPIAYRVESILQVHLVENGLGGIQLFQREVDPPYLKDYDASQEGGPLGWQKQFDTSRWGFFLAWQNDPLTSPAAIMGTKPPAGGAAVAFDTASVRMLADRRDMAVLWDIRVQPDLRGRGIGTALLKYAADWSRRRSCTQMKIETQDVNVPACYFYARQGCQLGEINRYAYAGHPSVSEEVMLVWYLAL